MTKTKMSWREKLHEKKPNLPFVEPIPPKMQRMLGQGTICVPAPWEVDEIMRGVPEGKLITVNQIREMVARKHGATVG
jgi:hypothetical protein